MPPADAATARDDPRSYIAEGRRAALAAGRFMPDHATGAALFADISGFTPLTEALAEELGPRRGAEELVAHVSRILAALIEDLHGFGGEVIYFSGDAITCWIEGDDATRATACGLAMQTTMRRAGVVTTAAGTVVNLALKVAVAVGEARRFVVGDPDHQLIDVLAGSVLDSAADAEQAARPGDVMVDPAAVAALGERVSLSATRTVNGNEFGVVGELTGPVQRAAAPDDLEPIPESITRQWLLPTVYERLATGTGALLAELRTVIPMFIRFGGIDFDGDPDAPATLDRFVRNAQHVIAAYGGSLLQLTLGDKGAYLYAVFGSPRAHEDDALRAVSAAWDLQTSLERQAGADRIRIGIASGRVLSGTCGHPLRRTFACMGDPVNLAARLMGKAAPGQTVVAAEVVAEARDRYSWDELEPMHLKGKAAPVAAFSLSGSLRRAVRRHRRYPLPMVGREQELAAIDARLGDALAGDRRVVGILAAAGLGKSRLISEAVRTMRASGHRVIFGESQAFGTTTSYLAWQEPLRTIFDLDDGPEWSQVARIERALTAVNPAHARRAPLLGPPLGLDIPDNEVTAAFDAKLRKASLESLLADIVVAEAGRRPLVIVLEDCHWMDEASLDLLEALVRETAGLPVLFVTAYRPEIPGETATRIRALDGFDEIVLRQLGAGAVRSVVTTKIRQRYARDVEPAPAVIDLIADRSGGNPFYVEELVNFLRRTDTDITDPSAVSAIELPQSLHSLVLSRIDSLPALPRRTLKVASVIGREFDSPTLPAVYPDLGTPADIDAALEELVGADLVTPDRTGEESWLFRHEVTRGVAYESLPFARRATLHEAAGGFYEARDPTGVNLDLIAHHYWHSENRDKKVEFQRRAGEAARAAYANAAAIEYFERLETLVAGDERRSVLLKLGGVLELVGDWDRAEAIDTEALSLAESAGADEAIGWCEVALAEVARKRGRYDDAQERLTRAGTLFDRHGDLSGTGRVLHLEGTLAAQRGDLVGARSSYERSLAVRREEGDLAAAAAVLSNLGVVAEYSGDLESARRFHEQALEARTALGDRWAIAVSNTNLGMIAVLQEHFDEARSLFETAMRLNGEVGDEWMVAVSHNNLGNAYRGLGDMDQARHHYGTAARAYLGYGDRWAAAFLLEDVAVMAASEGRAVAALELLGAADSMREAIDAPRSEPLEADLQRRVVAAAAGADEEELAAARSRGRSMDLPAAMEAIIGCCEPAAN